MEATENEYQKIIEIVELAITQRTASHSKKALDIIQEAIELGSALPSQSSEYAHSLHVRASIQRDLQAYAESFEDYYQAYRVYTAASNKGSAFHSLWHAGAVASESDKNEEAKTIFRRCLGNLKEIEITTIQQANFYRELAIHEERNDNLIGSYALWLHCLSLYKDVDTQSGIEEGNANIHRIREILKNQ